MASPTAYYTEHMQCAFHREHAAGAESEPCHTPTLSWERKEDIITASDPATRFYLLDPLLRRELYRYTVPTAPPYRP